MESLANELAKSLLVLRIKNIYVDQRAMNAQVMWIRLHNPMISVLMASNRALLEDLERDAKNVPISSDRQNR